MTAQTFDAALDTWLRAAQLLVDETYAGGTAQVPKLLCDPGRRYVRIVADHGVSRFAFAFIDRTTGDVLKPDGWKRPAKHARGNIYKPGALGVTGHGAHYL
jgi:hypothetical protein